MHKVPILSVNAVSVRYGAIAAVTDVSIDVQPGEMLAVLGPNGAGKSSLLSAISGLVRPSAGRIQFEDRDISRTTAAERSKRGIGHVLETRGIFPDLTVAENLRVAVRPLPTEDRLSALESATTLFPILQQRARQQAGLLSGGEQQMLSIARALCRKPKLLLIDELSLGLAPKIVDELFTVIGEIHQRGVAIVLVEQYVERALAVADGALVMEKGRVVDSGASRDLRGSPGLHASYLGATSESHDAERLTGELVTVELPAAALRILAEQAASQRTTVEALAARALTADVLGGRGGNQ